MANISSYNQLSSWNEDDDLLFVQQPDAPKKAHPSQMKEYVEAGDFESTGEVIDGHGNVLSGVVDEIGDLSETGLTGDSVAAQLGTAEVQITDVSSGIQDITRKIVYPSDEDAFLLLAYADILADMGPFEPDSPRCVTRMYTAAGIEHYIINAYRVQARWIYSICFTEGKAYYISYDCNDHIIKIKKSFTLT